MASYTFTREVSKLLYKTNPNLTWSDRGSFFLYCNLYILFKNSSKVMANDIVHYQMQ